MSNFQTLEEVGRGSGTHLQVAENLNKLTQQDRGEFKVFQYSLYVHKWGLTLNPLKYFFK